MPTADMPGTGDRIRMLSVLRAYPKLRARVVMRSTLTPGPRMISYRVTVGPRV